MIAKANLVGHLGADHRSNGSSRLDDRLFIAPIARSEEKVMQYETLIVERRGAVGLITLNRPHALNALNSVVLGELIDTLGRMQADDAIGAVVLTGSEKAFAAGADIKEMKDLSFMDAFLGDMAAGWDQVAGFRKPMIAAVAGFALGGGCEVAMMCDFIIAADTAKFGQPEITLGVIPGMGGTQRLTRIVGKSKAMDLVLTGRMMDAVEAERSGLVSRIVPADKLIDEAVAAAEKIASLSRPAVLMAKESVNRAYEVTLAEGMHFERRLFHSLFATEDQKEGMAAFAEKRKPQFKGR
jgi:enoyl-CoA hydratase